MKSLSKIRTDGKSQKVLFWLSFFAGLLGLEYFYINKKAMGIIKLIISWLGASVIIFSIIIVASTPDGVSNTAKGIPIWISSVNQWRIIIPSIIGGIVLVVQLLWSFVNSIKIYKGEFKDEKNQLVSNWNGNEIQFLNSL